MNSVIPSDVLGISIRTIEDEQVDLRTLIIQTCEEPLENAHYIVTNDDEGNPALQRFSAWTKSYILVLVNTAHGAYLLKHDRNY
jgi:hypothetical protein